MGGSGDDLRCFVTFLFCCQIYGKNQNNFYKRFLQNIAFLNDG